MAIQVSGTTVIDDSRNLVNVIGLKTVNSTSLLGSGDIAAGASTTYEAVGTYALGYVSGRDGATYIIYEQNVTVAGSLINIAGLGSTSVSITVDGNGSGEITRGSATLSGTWRTMSRSGRLDGDAKMLLFVRTV